VSAALPIASFEEESSYFFEKSASFFACSMTQIIAQPAQFGLL
jgi:hypothetical protein